MESKNNYFTKKRILITLVAFLVVVIGISFAYFAPQIMGGAIGNIDIISDSTDKLVFNVDKDVSIKISQFSLSPESKDLFDTVKATASLRSNNSSLGVEYTYNVYLNINKNEYVYSSTTEEPEIVMTVLDPNENEVTAIDGLEYKTVEGVNGTVTGFDITTKKGLIKIQEEYEIFSESSTTATVQEWNISFTFVNLNSDQTINTEKVLNAEVLVQQEDYAVTFAKRCIEGNESNFACDIIKKGDSTLLLHNSTLENGANDNLYRFAGASDSVNNYVCFGSDEEECPTDNLYRIIGVFDNTVKVIKNLQLSESMIWDSTNNTWSTSDLNLYLNETFLNTFDTAWQNKIAISNWQVGGNTMVTIRDVIPLLVYQNEVVLSAEDIIYTDKIGLMYVSDYGFAASQDNWTKKMISYNTAVSNNWMYSGVDEFTITRRSDTTGNFYYVNFNGLISSYGSIKTGYALRPVFYLNSDVKLKSGTGTSIDPYRL